jgi:hypothetical protein
MKVHKWLGGKNLCGSKIGTCEQDMDKVTCKKCLKNMEFITKKIFQDLRNEGHDIDGFLKRRGIDNNDKKGF